LTKNRDFSWQKHPAEPASCACWRGSASTLAPLAPCPGTGDTRRN
jgi:hypothetical protein